MVRRRVTFVSLVALAALVSAVVATGGLASITASSTAPVAAPRATPDPVGVGTLVTVSAGIRGGTAPFAYAWSLVGAPEGSSAALSSATAAKPTFSPDQAGAYVVSLTVTDAHGQSSNPESVTVLATEAPPPTAAATASPNPVAVGSPVQLGVSVKGGVAPFGYVWSLDTTPAGSGAALSSTTASNPTITPDQPGAYTLSLTVTDARALSAPTMQVTVMAFVPTSPTAVPKASPNPVAMGSLVQLSAGIRGGTAPLSYTWSLDAAPPGSAATLSSTTTAKPTFTPDMPGSYTITLTVTDAHGHSSTPESVTLLATTS
jgi:PKD repeat protein